MVLRCSIEPYGDFFLKEHCYEPYGEIYTRVCVSVRLFIAMEAGMMRIRSAAGFGEVIRTRRKALLLKKFFKQGK